ncbi:MAG: hypothetical protein V1921_04875 [Candidatus Altiarchaeota archaeon]
MKNRALFMIFILILIGVSFYYYEFVYIPSSVKLSPPRDLPFFSVSYVYQIQPTSPITFAFGSEAVSSMELSQKIEGDLHNIKQMGFEGVKLSFHFRENNYLPERIALKAAKEDLYPIGILMGHDTKPRDRAFTEDELREWESFVRTEVRANKGIIYFWEVWNEPDIDLFRYGTPEEFLTLLERTYKIIKEENPQARVIVTLDAFDRRPREFSEGLLSLGGGDYFDILSFHPYGANPYIREDVFNESIVEEKEMLARYNNRWPLWITEIGQPTSEVSEGTQADLAELVFKTAHKERIPIIWLHYSDQRLYQIGESSGWGLLDINGNPKPVFERIKGILQEAGKGTVNS